MACGMPPADWQQSDGWPHGRIAGAAAGVIAAPGGVKPGG
jgi:hypothetical protein